MLRSGAGKADPADWPAPDLKPRLRCGWWWQGRRSRYKGEVGDSDDPNTCQACGIGRPFLSGLCPVLVPTDFPNELLLPGHYDTKVIYSTHMRGERAGAAIILSNAKPVNKHFRIGTRQERRATHVPYHIPRKNGLCAGGHGSFRPVCVPRSTTMLLGRRSCAAHDSLGASAHPTSERNHAARRRFEGTSYTDGKARAHPLTIARRSGHPSQGLGMGTKGDGVQNV